MELNFHDEQLKELCEKVLYLEGLTDKELEFNL